MAGSGNQDHGACHRVQRLRHLQVACPLGLHDGIQARRLRPLAAMALHHIVFHQRPLRGRSRGQLGLQLAQGDVARLRAGQVGRHQRPLLLGGVGNQCLVHRPAPAGAVELTGIGQGLRIRSSGFLCG